MRSLEAAVHEAMDCARGLAGGGGLQLISALEEATERAGELRRAYEDRKREGLLEQARLMDTIRLREEEIGELRRRKRDTATSDGPDCCIVCGGRYDSSKARHVPVRARRDIGAGHVDTIAGCRVELLEGAV